MIITKYRHSRYLLLKLGWVTMNSVYESVLPWSLLIWRILQTFTLPCFQIRLLLTDRDGSSRLNTFVHSSQEDKHFVGEVMSYSNSNWNTSFCFKYNICFGYLWTRRVPRCSMETVAYHLLCETFEVFWQHKTVVVKKITSSFLCMKKPVSVSWKNSSKSETATWAN